MTGLFSNASPSTQAGFGFDEEMNIEENNETIKFQTVDEQPWHVNRNIHTMTKVLRARINNSNSSTDIVGLSAAIDDAYEEFVSNLIRDAGDEDLIYISFCNPQEDREM